MRHEISSAIATSFINVDSSRVRQPSLHEREIGYTEIWGNDNCDAVNNNEEEDNTIGSANNGMLVQLVLTQHRVAYQEQLLLRIAGIPHVVQNSPFSCTESTGSLPYLIDYGRDVGDKNKNIPPALVGRCHPRHCQYDNYATATKEDIKKQDEEKEGVNDFNFVTGADSERLNKNSAAHSRCDEGSDIFSYLRLSRHDVDLDRSLSASQKAQSHLYKSLILDKLNPILQFLRHCDDTDREMAYRACAGADSSNNLFRHPFAAFQYWCTRTVILRDFKWLQRTKNLNNEAGDKGDDLGSNADMLSLVMDAYLSFDALFENGVDDNSTKDHSSELITLFKTPQPTNMDVLLYAHLCEALVVMEPNLFHTAYPNLLRFWRSMHQRYFDDNDKYTSDSVYWAKKNNSTNCANAYYCSQSRFLYSQQGKLTSPPPPTNKAIATTIRRRAYPNPASTLHRLRLGGDILVSPPNNKKEEFDGYLSSRYYSSSRCNSSQNNKEEGAEKSWVKLQKKIAEENDQKWFGIVAASVCMVFIMTATKKE